MTQCGFYNISYFPFVLSLFVKHFSSVYKGLPTFIFYYFTMYPFPECTSIAISGSTCSGKTFWLYRLLHSKDDMFENPPEKVLYCYGIYQPLYEKMEKELPFITFQQGLPSTSDLEALAHDKTCNLVCLDDLMESVTTSSEMENLFVKGMHHRHLSVIFFKPEHVLSRQAFTHHQFEYSYPGAYEKSARLVSNPVFSSSSIYGQK